MDNFLDLPHLTPNRSTINLTLIIILIVAAVCGVFILLFSVRNKDRFFFNLQLLFWGSCGVLFVITLNSSSWSYAQRKLHATMGHEGLPQSMIIGLKSDLWKVQVFSEIPRLSNFQKVSLKEIYFNSITDMRRQRIDALREGWNWPMMLIISQLCGDTLTWSGNLGRCLRIASSATINCSVGALYIWIIWGVTYYVARHRSPYFMFLFGISLMICGFAYFLIIHTTCPTIIMPDEVYLFIKYGWSWQAVLYLGTCITAVGFFSLLSMPSTEAGIRSFTLKDSSSPNLEVEMVIHDTKQKLNEAFAETKCRLRASCSSENSINDSDLWTRIDESSITSFEDNDNNNINDPYQFEKEKGPSPAILSQMHIL